MISCPVVREHGPQKIKTVAIKEELRDWRKQLKDNLKESYGEMKYYTVGMEILEPIIDFETDKLAEFNINAIMSICKALGINRKFLRQSDMNTKSTSTERLIEIFVNADIGTQKLINLVTVMNTNRLFFEFVYEVYRNKLLIGESSIDLKDCNIFFSQKESQNDDIASWNETTRKRLKSLFLNFLIEADLVKWTDSSKTDRRTNRVFISIELENYLKRTNVSMYNAIAGVN